MSATTSVEVFLGNTIDEPAERRFLERLRADLERRGVRARIHANFVAGRTQRQIDFLIRTDYRLVHAELKTVDQSLPLVASINGPWAQQLPDGKLRLHDRNYYRQAHEATFAISDAMHELANRGDVPHFPGKYYSLIETVVCLSPDIPAGSRLDPYKYVNVVGYQQLLSLLTTAGPNPGWTAEHWDALARHLQLIPEQPDSPQEKSRHATIATLDDYRRRFVTMRRLDLHAYIPIPASAQGEMLPDPVSVLAEAMAAERVVTFIGPSGAGKSHTTLYAALTVAEAGGIPVWVRCGEYHRGWFSHALSRAVAPYTTESCLPLFRRAESVGNPVVVILDGLNECAPEDRSELLEQLGALRLRAPVAAVVTSTVPVELPAPDLALSALLPDDDTRVALLSSYGSSGDLAGAEAFQTPMELALAAQCGAQLRPGATTAELFDAYIGHLCPSETTRAALRRLAVEMDRQMRGALTTLEARGLLHRAAGTGMPAEGVDAALKCPLLSFTQGRAAFTHELFARFLTAEQLVLESGDIAGLVHTLQDPWHTDLQAHAVALEQDHIRRRDLLLGLADPGLLVAALRGSFGSETAATIRAQVVAVLTDAITATMEARFSREAGDPDASFDGHWDVPTSRTRTQQSLLHTAGLALADGFFLDETCQLLNVTDRRCAAEIRKLRDDGHSVPITAVVRATYAGFTYTDEREFRQLPASVVVTACQHSRFFRQRPTLKPSPAHAIWTGGTNAPACWGRLMTTLFLLNHDDPGDLALLPDLLTAAWKANGYHLRLTALTTVREAARAVDDTTRERTRAALEECDTKSIFLNSSLFEALAAYGGIEPQNTEEGIRAQIAAILAEPDNPDAWAMAQGLAGMVFEDQNLHGLYGEVLGNLDPAEHHKLHVMAARNDSMPSHRDWIMNAIIERLEYADDDTRTVLRDAALALDWGNPFREEAVGAHIIALRGWAQLAEELPPPGTDTTIARRAWRLVDELLFALLKQTSPTAEQLVGVWRQLLDECAPAAVDVLVHLKSVARIWEFNGNEPSMYQRLLAAWPEQMRQLAEWAVRNPGRLIATFDNGPTHHPVRKLVEDLATTGTEETLTLLQSYVDDAEIGAAAVTSIRGIKKRLDDRTHR